MGGGSSGLGSVPGPGLGFEKGCLGLEVRGGCYTL